MDVRCRSCISIWTVIGLIITLNLVTSIRNKTYLSAKENDIFVNVIITDTVPIEIFVNGTLIQCSMQCLEDIYCMSFFHNTLTKVCKLFDVDCINAITGIFENGWKYFTIVRGKKNEILFP
jgi:hypothetical protein